MRAIAFVYWVEVAGAFHFTVLATDPRSGLRAGVLETPHGLIETPAFMPVGTLATVKTLTPRDLTATGAQCLLANTYHLARQPGIENAQRLGGVRGLARWDGPLLTDSGGFQVFSLRGQRTIDDGGVCFSPEPHAPPVRFTPENVIKAQEALGADLIMPLDVCVPASASYSEAEQALERTQLWYRRSRETHRRGDQALFALVQGGLFADLRRDAARAAAQEATPGFAIGGFSIGEPASVTQPLLAQTLTHLPPTKPRYLMGIGSPTELVTYASLGVDLFDCVLPTRLARNGCVWSDLQGTPLDLGKRSLFACRGPIMADCPCCACQEWSLGALAALFQTADQQAYRLASIHNLTVLRTSLFRLRDALLASGVTSAPPDSFTLTVKCRPV